ncbi:hypothetical protein [Mixta calida]|uniref:hypothetical protein n=1 Tax=Mixta calida TaxID=665913 RepID=UPI00119D65E8|nr:hypothetical protein [Mixta calida]DAV72819.1 MAG TPA: hypothetical protein [Caudoviricetes sp.]
MTSNDELERQSFEAWAAHAYGGEYMRRAPGKEGEYKNWLIEDLWQAWQAAIASKQEQSDGETDIRHQR